LRDFVARCDLETVKAGFEYVRNLDLDYIKKLDDAVGAAVKFLAENRPA
jgi:hypothetical protein